MTVDRRIILRTAFVGGSVFLLCGIEQQPAPRGWNPGHVESDDPGWRMLAAARVTVDAQRGIMTASFTESIRRLNGAEFAIGGFLMPLDARRLFTHFVLTRRNASCPFCPPNEPTEAIEVFSLGALEYTPDGHVAAGRLQLVAESGEGLFYRLEHARVRRA